MLRKLDSQRCLLAAVAPEGVPLWGSWQALRGEMKPPQMIRLRG